MNLQWHIYIGLNHVNVCAETTEKEKGGGGISDLNAAQICCS